MSKPITKAQLIADMSERSNISKTEAAAAIDAVVATISAQLVQGNAVTLPGLAKFETRERAARQVRNPSTGGIIEKEADRAVKISALSALKDAVNS